VSTAPTVSALFDKTTWQRASLGKLLPIKYGKSLPAQFRDASGSHPGWIQGPSATVPPLPHASYDL
jgi:hypothetical protein